MAWNPSPEVAAARETAKLKDADMCIVIWIKGDQITMGTYGKTKKLCDEARWLGDKAWRGILK